MASGSEMAMQKVAILMREKNKESDDDYNPKVVSLGPYHHGKKNLKFVEDYKPEAVTMFIEDKECYYYLDAIMKNIENARCCYYLQESNYTDQEFGLMMLQDACIILNYIGLPSKELSNKGKMIKHLGTAVYNSIRRDMYLLENQVPFWILQDLYNLKYGNDTGVSFIKDMENYFFKKFYGDDIEEPPVKKPDTELPLHLLQIFRRVIVRGHDQDDGGDQPKTDEHHCCDINDLVSRLDNSFSGNREPKPAKPVFRSVTDLKAKGIKFRTSRIGSLKGVRFSQSEFCKSAELKLPVLYVKKDTRVFFKNLIAYEFSPYIPKPAIRPVTDYVNFMKLLVISKEDVKELREEGIIINGLGSDNDVVEMYNDLDTFGVEDITTFWGTKRDVEEHYRSTTKTWIADLRTKYFNNPWSILAFVVAIYFLSTDFVQTYYAANPKSPSPAPPPPPPTPRI